MLDIGWSEFLVIGVVALLVIGPRELPGALRTAGRYAARARSLAQEFRSGLDDIARETEIKDLEKKIVGDEDWRRDDWLTEDDAKKRSAAAVTSSATLEDKTSNDTASGAAAAAAADNDAETAADEAQVAADDAQTYGEASIEEEVRAEAERAERIAATSGAASSPAPSDAAADGRPDADSGAARKDQAS